MDKVQVQVKTKLNKDDKNPKLTVVSYDFSKCSVLDLIGPAVDTLTINLQSGWRRNKSVPQKLEVDVKDMVARMGTRSSAPLTAEGIVAVASAMKPEEVDALIERLKADRKAHEDAEKAAAKKEADEKKAAAKGKGGNKGSDGQKDQPSA